jgi:2-methylcitrate dehydratase PrpD
LVNGTLAHCMDFDDTHEGALGHISAPCWGVAFSLASHLGASEVEALGAYITGYEVVGRLFGGGMGKAVQVRGFHPTSVFGRFAAAAAACALLGLDEERTAHALGVAATTAGGLIGSFGTMSKPFHAGKAAMDGLLAAQLAAERFQAATNLLDAENGLAGAFVQDKSVRFQATEFSEGWQLQRNAFKPYACCKGTHATVDAARSLAGQAAGQRIEKVVVRVNEMHKRIAGKEHPRTGLEAKFSLSYCAAMGLLGYAGVAVDFSPERVAEPRLRELESRVQIVVGDEIPTTGAKMQVVLAGGRTLDSEIKIALGNPENPLSWEDLHRKFLGSVEPLLGAKPAAELYEALSRFEEPGRFSQVLRLVARPASG